MQSISNGIADGMFCEHCGALATQSDTDYGLLCDRCAIYWEAREREAAQREAQKDTEATKFYNDFEQPTQAD